MSVKAMSWVFDYSPYTLASRLVHLVLADKANDHNDYELWMHQDKIAAAARISVSSVGKILRQMVADGYLVQLEDGRGRGRTARYRLVMETRRNDGFFTSEKAQIATVKGADSAPENPQIAQTHLLPTQEVTQGNTMVRATDTFDAFWSTYPRHEAKATAERAWAKATKATPPAVILAGAARYRDDPNREPRYTAHPATWLNAGRWTDDPLPPRAGRTDPLRGRHTTTLEQDLATAMGANG